MLLLGAPQMADEVRLDYFRKGSVNHIMRQNVDFFIVLGDIADDNTPMIHHEKDVMGQLGIDGYHVTGNHDLNYESVD